MEALLLVILSSPRVRKPSLFLSMALNASSLMIGSLMNSSTWSSSSLLLHHHYQWWWSLYLDLAVPPPGQVRQDGKHLELEHIKLWSDFIFYNQHTIPSLNYISSLASTNMRLIWVLCAQTWSWEMSILFMILRTLNISLSVNSPRPLGSNLVEEKHFQNI